MKIQNSCENYPLSIPLLSILLSLSIYAIGIFILSGFGLIVVLLYVVFCVLFEYRVLSKSCRYCYYYGKLCGLGKGKLAPLFFKKGDPKIFIEKTVSWKDLIPDFLVFLIPVLSGIFYLFFCFNFLTLALIVLITILAMPVVGFMRGCLLCPKCKQLELGCPAQKLFG
ncbi:MAG: hypothetical protein NT099_08955 [Candidatus Saganbacteria bacterium]|nr:hypothetical protein [Candidatus Saganbacteria bacterium]